jgi:Zn-dependent protease with chaperone function/uncharacterized tellurite resistance protein B-like protein
MTLIRLMVALVITLIVPVAGFLMSDRIIWEINVEMREAGASRFDELCAMPDGQVGGYYFIDCLIYGSITLLRKLSIIAALFGLGIPAVLMSASLIAGTSRNTLATVFPLAVQTTLVLITISVALQGAVLTFGFYVGEEYYLGRVHRPILIGIGAVAAAVTYKLFMECLGYGGKLMSEIHGIRVDEDKAPGLHAFVKGLAEKLGAQAPDNIIIGIEPNFFVTGADVRVPDSAKPLTGETLYVSLPLARLMTVAEFGAVIGHELGHFRGKDTIYSMKFAPAYAGLAEALEATRYEKGEKLFWIAKLPARAMLSLTMNVFAMNRGALSRERELLADQAGAEASSAKALVTSLIKISAYSMLWDAIHRENIDRLNDGRTTRNLSSLLESRGRHDIETHTLEEIIDLVAKHSTAHPFDTHPTVSQRMKSLGVERDTIDKADLLAPENSAALLFRNSLAVEEKLTVMEHKLMNSLGYVVTTGKGRQDNTRYLAPVYRVAAAVIFLDGEINTREIHKAEIAGAEAFPGFDSIDFRQACDYVDDSPDPVGLAGDLNARLNPDQKVALIAYLKAIAEADGHTNWAEWDFIESVAAELGVASA